ncbi:MULTISPECIES: hypothetical protein [unclassified Microcoleus]|uniref:hypothetical protein n=1 Tax=unclassified Microcoleus TaxID=2642155 RepID=UPI001DD50791|nr:MULTISPECIES: hypothetical protein [unclassified Microcoleus]MCC3412318.1 hypothetical protein [Microcoleus sp. PH2017_02_FOX_O_A]MCC3473443.1 hypothetical protein [Microcoleus sp. PH2017_13_LAR_U_A]MCC3485819.1 hypothetical protein [Microcoleus sp. PH2017_14_LAR_D_A]MCC3491547.1 hypothetical protein [Microcoleus sp. PH2017_16_JOR_D_A]MCC3598424.1 hypothetical protein [Microcoleus sp. PH2017_26_ELK_O_A]
MGFGIWDLGFEILEGTHKSILDLRFLIWDFKGNSQIAWPEIRISLRVRVPAVDRTFAAKFDDNNGTITVEFL